MWFASVDPRAIVIHARLIVTLQVPVTLLPIVGESTTDAPPIAPELATHAVVNAEPAVAPVSVDAVEREPEVRVQAADAGQHVAGYDCGSCLY